MSIENQTYAKFESFGMFGESSGVGLDLVLDDNLPDKTITVDLDTFNDTESKLSFSKEFPVIDKDDVIGFCILVAVLFSVISFKPKVRR